MLPRPELPYEHSFDVPAYSSGTKKSQFVLASDIVWFFGSSRGGNVLDQKEGI